MRDSWLIRSKLEPPRLAPLLPRAVLPSPLPPVTLLVAGPGYGKTCALRAAVEGAPPEAVVLWYALDRFDADLATFFHYMVAGIQAHIPQFGEDLLALLMGEPPDARLLFGRFFQALARFNLPRCYLVLDDLHHLLEARPEAAAALSDHFDRLPARTHLLISTRRRWPAPLTRLRARGGVAVLGAEQLAFGPDEALAYVRAREPGLAAPEAWLAGTAALEGWPLGYELALAGASVDPGRLSASDEEIQAYVLEEVFAWQPPERQRFMLEAALLEPLTPRGLDEVIGEGGRPHLEALAAEHLLVGEGPEAWRFPGYMRPFLLAEGERRLPAAALAEARRRVARHHEAAGRLESALAAWLAAKAWPEALALCGRLFPAMRFDGRHARIRAWLDAFPRAVADDEPLALMWEGHLASQAGQAVEARAYYERASARYAERGDEAGVFKALVRRCVLALQRREPKLANQLLLQAQARSELAEREDWADFLLARALAADTHGDLGLVAECNRAVLETPVGRNVELAASHCIALFNLFTVCLNRGELREAARHLERLQAVAEAWRFHPYRLTGLVLQAELRLLEHDAEGAAALIRSLPEAWEELLDWHDRACAHAVLGGMHRLRGAWKEAEAELERSLAIFEDAGFDLGRKVPLERLMWLALARGQHERLEARLAQAGPASGASLYDMALRLPLARSLHLRGEPERALAVLEALVPELEQAGARLHLTKARLYEAACREALGDGAGALAARRAATATIEAEGYAGLLADDRAVASAEAPGALVVHMFGGFEARLGEALLNQWPRRRSKLILAALALYPRGLSLPELVEVLGAKALTPAGVTSWHVDMSALRRVLEPALEKGAVSRFVTYAQERYALEAGALEACDVRAFEAACARADRLRDADPAAAAASYAEAASLYRGDLLAEGFFLKSFEAERRKLREQAIHALTWLSAHAERQGDAAGAEAALERAVAIAPCEEALALLLMRLQAASGQADRARQVYWDCRKALKLQLGLAPGAELEAFYRSLPAAGRF